MGRWNTEIAQRLEGHEGRVFGQREQPMQRQFVQGLQVITGTPAFSKGREGPSHSSLRRSSPGGPDLGQGHLGEPLAVVRSEHKDTDWPYNRTDWTGQEDNGGNCSRVSVRAGERVSGVCTRTW